MHGGLKLVLTLGLILAAVYLDRWAWLLALLVLDAGLYFLAGLGWRALWRDGRWLLVQIAIVILLFALRYGWSAGFEPGLKVGVKILLFFLPGALVLRTSQMSRMSREMSWLMPRQISFLVFTSLRFVPFFAREIREIALAQRMRGAALSPRQLANPRKWPDLVNCLLLPLMVRALQTAGEAADSAQARGLNLGGGKAKGGPDCPRQRG
ncbi:MAG: energy-coupling factor transporter transmembrane protein EcfT [Deltaproteobacteria bacterium]|nr:energy-coupling factor transporter transmembrane protein EcfT [Deltaproteobacteria bacterium]